MLCERTLHIMEPTSAFTGFSTNFCVFCCYFLTFIFSGVSKKSIVEVVIAIVEYEIIRRLDIPQGTEVRI